MADLTQKVQILIGGDATQAKQVIAEVEKSLKESQSRTIQSAGTHGTAAGDQFGRAFNRAQDRWLSVAEGGFRRWGGRIGSIVADAIAAFDKIDKAKFASEIHQAKSGGSGNGLSAVDVAAGAAIGSKLGTAVEGVSSVGQTLATRANGIRYDKFYKSLSDANKLGIKDGVLDPSQISSFAGYMARPLGKISDIGVLAGNSISNFGSSIKKLANMDLGGISKYVGGTVGLGIGASIATVAGMVEVYKKLGAQYDEIIKKQQTFSENKNIIDSIENLGNSTEKTIAILKKFGADGLSEYRKLIEAQRKLEDELDNNKGKEARQFKGKAVSEGLSEFFGNITDSAKNAFFTIAGGSTGGYEDMARQDAANRAKSAIDQKTIDDKAIKKANKQIENDKALIDSTEEKYKIEKQLKELEIADDDDKKLQNLKDRVKAQQEFIKMIDPLKDKVLYEQESNELLSRQVDLTKALNDEKKKQKEIDKAAYDRMVDEEYRRDDQLKKNKDRDKYSVSDLAGDNNVNPRVRNAANQIMNNEKLAKQANANGRPDLAQRYRAAANQLRKQLGARGTISSGEYNPDDYPTAAQDNRTPSQRLRDQMVEKYGDAAKPYSVRGYKMDSKANANSDNKPKTIEGFFAENGFLPTKLKSGD